MLLTEQQGKPVLYVLETAAHSIETRFSSFKGKEKNCKDESHSELTLDGKAKSLPKGSHLSSVIAMRQKQSL